MEKNRTIFLGLFFIFFISACGYSGGSNSVREKQTLIQDQLSEQRYELEEKRYELDKAVAFAKCLRDAASAGDKLGAKLKGEDYWYDSVMFSACRQIDSVTFENLLISTAVSHNKRFDQYRDKRFKDFIDELANKIVDSDGKWPAMEAFFQKYLQLFDDSKIDSSIDFEGHYEKVKEHVK